MQPPENYLPSLIPELKTRGLTIDFSGDEVILSPGDFIVSIGKNRKPGSVYQVISLRKVKSEKYPQRYAYRVVKCPELVADVKINPHSGYTWIEGHDEMVIAITWNTRDKKKK